VLVLGAGGFTLSHREPSNRYTYVDIDPKIREIAEARFLKAPIRGEFIVDDARRYVRATGPALRRGGGGCVQQPHFHPRPPGDPRVLAGRPPGAGAGGRAAGQPDPRRQASKRPYARNLLATIESVFGRCGVEVLHKGKPLSNVIVSCYASSRPGGVTPYSDERNGADVDLARSR
jgi:hypothetical protein